MAKKVVIVDDLDGKSEADETVVYGIDGEFFEVDLSAENASALRDLLRPYLDVSRPIGAREAVRRAGGNGNGSNAGNGSNGNGSGSAGGANGSAGGAGDPAVVRAWAQANGVEVGEKGRIPEQVVQRWREATSAPGPAEQPEPAREPEPAPVG